LVGSGHFGSACRRVPSSMPMQRRFPLDALREAVPQVNAALAVVGCSFAP